MGMLPLTTSSILEICGLDLARSRLWLIFSLEKTDISF